MSYRAARSSGVTIEDHAPLSSALGAPAKHNGDSFMVLYTHDSPFIKCRARSAKKMSAEEFAKLGEKYRCTNPKAFDALRLTQVPSARRFGLTELTKFYKLFLKLQIDKGIDQEGLKSFLAKYGTMRALTRNPSQNSKFETLTPKSTLQGTWTRRTTR